VYAHKAKLQKDQKLPKGNRRGRLGQFVGFSDEHSSLVANVWHLTTRYISPQFYVVFDDLFETVNCTGVDDRFVESICNGLFQRNQELMTKTNLMRLVIAFTNLLPYMRFGLMKQDAASETRIVSVSTIEKKISCVMPIVLSENPSLNPLLRIWMMRMS
jgi:hypothetical protein